MLEITIPEMEFFNEETEEFVQLKERTLRLEHSLVSISKWESKWEIPFLSSVNKTPEQLMHYIECMTLTQNVPKDTYLYIPSNILDKITEYIESKQTATTFSDKEEKKGRMNGEFITNEIIYYWMIKYQIPKEHEKWHLNRLLTLIRVIQAKETPNKKMSRTELLARQRALNAKRRAEMGSKG